MAGAPPTASLEGARVGKYRVDRLIGSGGMGTVYLATDVFLRRAVALKVLSPLSESYQDALERFFREARAVARLEHPNIVRIYDADDDPDMPFIAMEYVKGIDARQLLQRAPGLATTLNVLAQVFEGLGHAHDLGVVHRDVKPANVLVGDDGVVKLIDFGLARLHDDDRDLTRGQVFGSACYMAPEQITDPRGIDYRTDIYAAGVLLYQLVTGRVPFQGATLAETLVQVVHGERPDLTHLVSGCPQEVSDVLRACLARDREGRPQSAKGVAERLRIAAFHLTEGRRAAPREAVPAVRAPEPPALDAAPDVREDVAPAVVPAPTPARPARWSPPVHVAPTAPPPPPPVREPAPLLSEPPDDLSSYDFSEEIPEVVLPAGRPARPAGGVDRKAAIVVAAVAVLAVVAISGAVLLRGPGKPSGASAGPTGLAPLDLEAPSGTTAPPGGPAAAAPSGPVLSAVRPAPGVRGVRVQAGEAFEFRVATSGGAALSPPRWRLNDELVAEGTAYFFRAPAGAARHLVTVTYDEEKGAEPQVLVWYVDVP